MYSCALILVVCACGSVWGCKCVRYNMIHVVAVIVAFPLLLFLCFGRKSVGVVIAIVVVVVVVVIVA